MSFDFLDVDFGADFTFEDAFDFASIGSGSFKYDNVSCEFSDECMLRLQRRIHQKKHVANRTYHFENIKRSCWCQYFTRHRRTQESMHELSSSNHFGDFHLWCCMPMAKIEVLTNISIDHGYNVPPRSHWQRVVFCEHLELVVMSALHLLAKGAAFCSCKVLCSISTS
jgi:hypothetical protein